MKFGALVQLVRIHACHAWGHGSSPVRTASQESKIRKSLRFPTELGLFYLFEVKQNIAFLRSMSGANLGSFFEAIEKAPGTHHTSLKISIFTPLEQGKFLTEKHRSYVDAKLGAFFGERYNLLNIISIFKIR